jgi:hypothetical protein
MFAASLMVATSCNAFQVYPPNHHYSGRATFSSGTIGVCPNSKKSGLIPRHYQQQQKQQHRRIQSSSLTSTLETTGRSSKRSSSGGSPFLDLPTLDMLQEWTLEFFEDFEDSGGWSGIEGYSHYFEEDEFVHVAPNNVGPLNKHDFVQLMKYHQENGLDFGTIVPDLTLSLYGWHQDPHDPWRVWVVVRYSGTHVGTATLASLGGLELSPSTTTTGEATNRFMTGPELHSFQWTLDKKIRWQTTGFVGDSNTGSNEGYGGILGILISLGLPRISVDAIVPFTSLPKWLSQFWANRNPSKTTMNKSARPPPRAQTPYSKLPQWWHERKRSSKNICR